jgi:hypothetical protein
LLGAVFDNHVAAVLRDDLLRQGNSDSAIEGWFAVKGEEELTSVERTRVETQTTDLDHHIVEIRGSSNGEFTTLLHASQGGLDYGTETLLDKMSIQFYMGYPVT